MTFPFFLMTHALFGFAMGRVFEKRFLADGHILAPSLLWTLAPVTLLTAPMGMLLARYSGGWFFHGFFVGEGKILFERFHLGLVIMVLFAVWLITFGGMLLWPVMKSRAQERSVKWLARGICILAGAMVLFDYERIFWIMGAEGSHLLNHPAGWLSIIVLGTLLSWHHFVNKKFGTPKDIDSW
jgi:hypothetical protein